MFYICPIYEINVLLEPSDPINTLRMVKELDVTVKKFEKEYAELARLTSQLDMEKEAGFDKDGAAKFFGGFERTVIQFKE